mgnify:CR=1 FL=1|jgi:hypothetical protein|tara:strand:- start:532 stop:1113 length:582 start_codon:yes stop_codon:yes gene_type:complete
MSNSFQDEGYVAVDSLLDTPTVTTFSKYFENKIRRGEWKENFDREEVGDSRYGYYSDPLLEVLLLRCLSTIEESAGLELEPTYSYARVYQGGEELLPHTDRPSCEVSASINIAVVGGIWPIWVQYKDNEPIKFLLSPGDAVVYKGCEAMHWRTRLPKEQLNVQLMLHYVDKNGPKVQYKFDERKALGYARHVG